MCKVSTLSRAAMTLIVCSALVLFSSAALADKGEIEVGGFLGVHVFSSANELGVRDVASADAQATSIPIGVRGGYGVIDALTLEAELAILPSKMRGSNINSTVFLGRAHGVYTFFTPDKKLRPFALGGAGFMSTGSSSPDQLSDTDFSVYAGGGAKYRLTDRLSLRADARVLFPPSSQSKSVTTDFELLVGVYTTFGGGPKTAAKTTDNSDPDGDGIVGAADNCPNDAENVNGFEDEDGCPDETPDYDGDGLVGAADKCPRKPETVNGFMDQDGCPDELPDADGDGVTDAEDKCPNAAEDRDNFEDEDGCPDEDNDSDGIADASDKCPDKAEDRDNFEDEDGCPDADNDGDGILDVDDKCPLKAEVFNGVKDEDGCPDRGKVLVVVREDSVDVTQKIFFRTNKASIKRRSEKTLRALASVLKVHSTFRIRVEGHTDDRGNDERNLTLSQQRADAVMAFLVAKGVAQERLEAKGFGKTQPLVEGKSRRARKKNRRVEFKIVGRTPAP